MEYLPRRSDEGPCFLQVVDAERNLGVAADGAEVDQAYHIDARVAELARERGEGSRLVIKPHDEDGPHRRRIAVLHQRFAGLHRLIHNQAHVRPPARGFRADCIDVDPRRSENRGKLREFTRTIRDVDIDLDHAASLPWIAFQGYKRCAAGVDVVWLGPGKFQDIRASTARLPRPSSSAITGFRSIRFLRGLGMRQQWRWR